MSESVFSAISVVSDIATSFLSCGRPGHRLATLLVGVPFIICGLQSHAGEAKGLDELSIEELMSMEVTSVSKKAQKLSDSPAAVFVITAEDVRRSGVTSVPEALRLAPGVNVARIDSNKWAVSARGFNGRFANKLLVLVDGRTVYSPSFSGVYWEARDVMLEDLDRIEVIRGPGATLWGANAVNGVINIITRHAADTAGATVTLVAGDEEQQGALRVGGKLGENNYGRAYVKGSRRDDFKHPDGDTAGDTWDTVSVGFRTDYQLSHKDSLTLQGDFYSGDIDQHIIVADLAPPYVRMLDDAADIDGWNVLGRWSHTISARSEFTLQGYIDRANRDEVIGDQSDETFDIDFQHLFALGQRQIVVWGAGYRYSETNIEGRLAVANIGSPHRDDELINLFVQDEITLIENTLSMTVGAKVERNDYTGTEVQPSTRFMWTPADGHKAWFSVSRAVRTASRAEHDLNVLAAVIPPSPPFVPAVALVVSGNDQYDAEELTAWELGYRFAPVRALSLDMTAFYNDYDQLRSTALGAPVFKGFYIEQPLGFSNQLSGETHGFELAAVWQASKAWRWDLAYSFLETDFDTQTAADKVQNGIGPRHQVSLRSLFDISDNLEFDVWARYVDKAMAVDGRAFGLVEIDSYVATDVRLAWRPDRQLELALVGQNLFDSQHLEYIQESFTLPTEVERGVYIKLSWQP